MRRGCSTATSSRPTSSWWAVASALAKKAEQRWSSCTAFVAALAAGVKRAVPGGPTVRVARPVKPPPRRSLWPLATAGLALLAAVLFALLLGRFGQRDEAKP